MTSPSTSDDFANDAIDVSGLPRLDDQAFVSLDPRYRTGWLGVLAIVAVVALTVTGLAIALSDASTVFAIIGGSVLLLIAVTAVLWNIELKRLGYLLREHDVSLRSGVLTHRVATVPFVRVQHVSIRRGPFERLLGLATVDVSSAGPDISIPGLAVEDADRVKQLITERAGVEPDEVLDPPTPPAPPTATPPAPPTAAPSVAPGPGAPLLPPPAPPQPPSPPR